MNSLSWKDYQIKFPKVLQKDFWRYAVCVIKVQEDLIFIIRSLSMPTHPGQIAFFGGNKKPNETPIEVSKREFEEETGFSSDILTLKGFSKPVRTKFGQVTIPVIFEINEMTLDVFLRGVKSNGEWTDVFSIPLKILKQDDHWSKSNLYFKNQKSELLFYNYQAVFEDSSLLKSSSHLTLWGMTAHVVYNLTRLP